MRSTLIAGYKSLNVVGINAIKISLGVILLTPETILRAIEKKKDQNIIVLFFF
jgi:phosphosulfolactate synthase (CoM biosynthesis protein A)